MGPILGTIFWAVITLLAIPVLFFAYSVLVVATLFMKDPKSPDYNGHPRVDLDHERNSTSRLS
jgi:hypothetical protein